MKSHAHFEEQEDVYDTPVEDDEAAICPTATNEGAHLEGKPKPSDIEAMDTSEYKKAPSRTPRKLRQPSKGKTPKGSKAHNEKTENKVYNQV